MGAVRLVNATGYSLAGLRAAWKNEEAFRLECILSLVLIPGALWLGTTPLESALMIGSWMIVLVTELINSAIEAIVDRIGSEDHELSGRAKDLGSAAVFASIILAAAVWGIIVWQ